MSKMKEQDILMHREAGDGQEIVTDEEQGYCPTVESFLTDLIAQGIDIDPDSVFCRCEVCREGAEKVWNKAKVSD